LRLVKHIAYECPIVHISDTFYKLLHKHVDHEVSGVSLEEDPISAYFGLEVCPKVLNLPSDVDKDTGEVIREYDSFSIEDVFDKYAQSQVELKKLLDGIFYQHGRIRPHERILCWFPKYLEYYRDSYELVVGSSDEDSGVLKWTEKLYLGIMAISCYKCDYLLNILEEQFVLVGGDLNWITDGLKKVDPRLAKFAELNEIMAFKPWILHTNMLEKLMKTDEISKGWNVQ